MVPPKNHTPCISCKMRIWLASFPFNPMAQRSEFSAKALAEAKLSFITTESCAGDCDYVIIKSVLHIP